MKKLQVRNTKVFPYSAEQVWNIISDFVRYPEWWPSNVKTGVLKKSNEIIGSQIEVRPYGGKGFRCEVVDVQPNTELRMEHSGIYTGFGVWTISENNQQSNVVYEINLDIDNLLIRMLSLILPVDKIHYKLMEKVLIGLEQKLKTKFGNINHGQFFSETIGSEGSK